MGKTYKRQQKSKKDRKVFNHKKIKKEKFIIKNKEKSHYEDYDLYYKEEE